MPIGKTWGYFDEVEGQQQLTHGRTVTELVDDAIVETLTVWQKGSRLRGCCLTDNCSRR